VLDWTTKPQFCVELLRLVQPVDTRISAKSSWMPRGYDATEEARLETFGPTVLPQSNAWSALRSWWLAHERGANTPNWDLAVSCEIEGTPGLVLVEAKANVPELSAAGKLLPSDASDASRDNHARITNAIEEACAALCAIDRRTAIRCGSHYQLANRIAFGWKLASLGIPTIVMYLGFLGDEGIRDAGEPFRDESHWNEVFGEYARACIPRELFERRIDCGPAPVWFIVRSKNIVESSPPPPRGARRPTNRTNEETRTDPSEQSSAAAGPAVPSYRGNVGNFLQHWVLCEILNIAKGHARQLDFVDAHSMAPFARSRPKIDVSSALFDRARDRLPGDRSVYEVAWEGLTQGRRGYPNSAAFVEWLWREPYSMLLCELQPVTAGELRAWARSVAQSAKCVAVQIVEGDWRKRFRSGLSASGDLVLVSFDPYMFDRHGPGRLPNAGNLYLEDLDLLATAIAPITAGVIVQLSTYSANNDNPQASVIEAVRSRIAQSRLALTGVARVDGNMMSMILTRDVQWADALRDVPARFQHWLERLKAESTSAAS